MKNNRKIIITSIIGVVALCIITLSLTYAYWQINKNQTGENVVNTACLEVTLEEEQDDILLGKTYPIKDEEGNTLTPYKFKIHNKCEDNASYVINLESMNKKMDETEILEENKLLPKYLKVKLNEESETGITSRLDKTSNVNPTITNAYESHQLLSSYLSPNQEKNYELRLWIDYDADLGAMSKTYVGKISVISTYLIEENIPPSAELALNVCEDTVTATINGSANGEKKISKYEYNIDDNGWNTGEKTQQFFDLEKGNHSFKVRVTDSNNITSVVEKQVNIDYVRPTNATLLGQDIPVTTTGDGLYRVSHCGLQGTTDDTGFGVNEYRYAGSNYTSEDTSYVHNYINFNCDNYDSQSNCEKWQIIGLVNVKTDTGTEQRVKIIRKNEIDGQAFPSEKWTSGNTNDWTTASLKNTLNGNYYNNTMPEESVKGITEQTKSIIDSDVTWSIGGISGSIYSAKDYYKNERGTATYNKQPYEWTKGNDAENHNGIGLMMPSDYGYAVGGSVRSTCLNKLLNSYQNDDCSINDWLVPSASSALFISPHSTMNSVIFGVSSTGGTTLGHISNAFNIYPVVYLRNNYHITNGDGTFNNPFQINL